MERGFDSLIPNHFRGSYGQERKSEDQAEGKQDGFDRHDREIVSCTVCSPFQTGGPGCWVSGADTSSTNALVWYMGYYAPLSRERTEFESRYERQNFL